METVTMAVIVTVSSNCVLNLFVQYIVLAWYSRYWTLAWSTNMCRFSSSSNQQVALSHFYFAPTRRVKYCDQHVCQTVCLLTYLKKPMSKFQPIFCACYWWPLQQCNILYDTMRYGRFACTQKLTLWPA